MEARIWRREFFSGGVAGRGAEGQRYLRAITNVTDSNRGRVFTGPDGIEYKLKLGGHLPEVCRSFCYSSRSQARVLWIALFK